jgi:acyl carrier protein
LRPRWPPARALFNGAAWRDCWLVGFGVELRGRGRLSRDSPPASPACKAGTLSICRESSVETKALDHTELANQIIDVIVKEGMVDREKATLDATIESLDLKSIDIVMILTAIEDKFDVYIPMDGPFHEAKNIGDLIDAIAAYIGKEKS